MKVKQQSEDWNCGIYSSYHALKGLGVSLGYECHVPFVSHTHCKKSIAPKKLLNSSLFDKSAGTLFFPSAVKCLESSLESTLCYLSFPKDEWLSLRTTNPVERPNKEFKREQKVWRLLQVKRVATTC